MGVPYCCLKQDQCLDRKDSRLGSFVQKLEGDLYLVSFVHTPRVFVDQENENIPRYEKSQVLQERSKINDSEDSKSNGDSQQDINPINANLYKDFDDWRIISNDAEQTRIKKIVVYSDYYVCGMDVTYVNQDGKETTSKHAFDKSCLRSESCKKSEIDIEEDDYIVYISCSYSSQKKFIRSFKIGTNNRKLVINEGEIELKNAGPNMLKEVDLVQSKTSNDDSRKSRALFRSLGLGSQEEKVENAALLRDSHNSEACGRANEHEELFHNSYEDSFSLKRASLVDAFLKTQSCNFKKLKLKVCGFKTYFNGYMEDIEVYASTLDSSELSQSSFAE
ncbi:unnamed protein product [Moneuplotes crassus]|uniref:Jacalin-type lectin domain-containing protein n=1 Tax=Euplotes crassus TaxID=5936 RepID=A0AAD2CXM4_EUPCR|nr:unnamed protein product [Moneuplotes crassus]